MPAVSTVEASKTLFSKEDKLSQDETKINTNIEIKGTPASSTSSDVIFLREVTPSDTPNSSSSRSSNKSSSNSTTTLSKNNKIPLSTISKSKVVKSKTTKPSSCSSSTTSSSSSSSSSSFSSAAVSKGGRPPLPPSNGVKKNVPETQSQVLQGT